jgi:hypothetical protein
LKEKQVQATTDDETNLHSEIDILDYSDTDEEEYDVKTHKQQKKNSSIRCDHLWAYLLHNENVPNLQKLVHFAFSIPASNAFCESIFSHMKFLWNNNRNKMKNELVGAELKIKMNSDFNCTEFYEYLLHKPDLLKQIRSSEKYSHIAKVPRKTT